MEKIILISIVTMLFLPESAVAATHILTEAMGTGDITPSFWDPDAVPGDTIIIAADRVSNIKFRNFDGTPENPYTFTNPSDAKVRLTTGTTNAIQFFESDNFKLLGNNYESEIYGIEIDGSSGGIGGGVRIWCSSNWEVAYIHIHNTTAGIAQNNNGEDGDTWACPSGAWTEANSMGDCRVHHVLITDTNAAPGEGMYFGKTKIGDYPQWNTLEIDHNSVYRTSGDGIQAGQTATWLKIHANHIEETGVLNEIPHMFGITTPYETSGVEIYRNKIIKAGWNGIAISASTSGQTSIHDNVIWEAGYLQPGNGIKIDTPASTPIIIINNTIVGSTKDGIRTSPGVTTGEIRYNLLVANVWEGINSDYSTLNDNKIAASTSTEHFVSAVTGNFRLTANSPAKDAGGGGGYSPIDFDGNLRPQGEAPDIGAFVYVPSASASADLNQDGRIDIQDIQLCVNVILETETDPDIVARADVNGDESVNTLDLQKIVNVILG